MTQDDKREKSQIVLFDLTPLKGRSNKYIPDAFVQIKEKKWNIELKTFDKNKGLCSTARNVTLEKIENWRKVTWLFSEYEKGGELTGNHWLVSGESMEPFFKEQETKILKGTKSYGGLEDWWELKDFAQSCGFNLEKLNKVEKILVKRGGLNDPRISRKKIEELGIKLEGKNLANSLREILLAE